MPTAADRFGNPIDPPDDCVPWDRWYPTVLDGIDAGSGQAVVVVVMVGLAPVLDHWVDGRWTAPCDGIDWYLDDLAARVAMLRARGVDVVFVLPAVLGTRATMLVPDDLVDRMGCIRSALAASMRAQGVATIDLQAVLCPEGDCDALRTSDGVHVEPGYAAEVLRWVVDRVLAAAAR